MAGEMDGAIGGASAGAAAGPIGAGIGALVGLLKGELIDKPAVYEENLRKLSRQRTLGVAQDLSATPSSFNTALQGGFAGYDIGNKYADSKALQSLQASEQDRYAKMRGGKYPTSGESFAPLTSAQQMAPAPYSASYAASQQAQNPYANMMRQQAQPNAPLYNISQGSVKPYY